MLPESHFRDELDLSKIDWSRVDAPEDAEIACQAAEDTDTAPVFTAAELLVAILSAEPRPPSDSASHTRGRARYGRRRGR